MKYRKKPVVIEAMQFSNEMNGDACAALVSWLPSDVKVFSDAIDIHTLEGVMTASRGDWIIKGVKGEFYPCKPDIFEATYEAAD